MISKLLIKDIMVDIRAAKNKAELMRQNIAKHISSFETGNISPNPMVNNV
jgi:hypothetical protein